MDLRQYLRAIRRGWWIVVLVALLGGAAGYAKADREPDVYAANVSFFIGTPSSDGSTAYGNDQFAQQRANSYAELLSSPQFARLMIANSTLTLSPAQLAAKISGSAQINTVLVDATIRDTSVRRLRTIQRAVAEQFPVYITTQIETAETVTVQLTSQLGVSSVPVAPRTAVDAILGFVAGLVLGLLLAGLRELLDTSLRTGAELEELVGVPILGGIVRDPNASQQPVATGTGSPSRRAEDFRQLRTNLEFIHTAERVQVIVVTSSVAGEGKSSTAVNIAATAAEQGSRVLLVDADLRRPQIADYLGFDRFVGLTTVLTGQVAASIAVRTWGEHGLAVLPSGATPPNPSELLNSAPMHALVAQWRTTYDLIVIDTPPALVVTDAAVCSELADGVLLVYRYGKTRRANLMGALHALRTVDARIVGVVLNMRPRKGADGERYGNYDAYVGNPSGSPLRRAIARVVPRLARRRRELPSTTGPASPALTLTPQAPPVLTPDVSAELTPEAEPALDGFRPPTEAVPVAVVGPAGADARFHARRRRRPLRSGRVRIELLPVPEPGDTQLADTELADTELANDTYPDDLEDLPDDASDDGTSNDGPSNDTPTDATPGEGSAPNGHPHNGNGPNGNGPNGNGTNGTGPNEHGPNGHEGAHRSGAARDRAHA